MCGINGIVRLRPTAAPVDREELIRTRDSMALRGPDAAGLWIAEDQSVGLGHRRLAIIDLSPGGVQPMSWADGRYQIVFNGEIYNYRELRQELETAGVAFRSHSDTEVLLALFAREGAAMLNRLRGMFAFGIWDQRERKLFLARDPYGIKPLYYSADGKHLRFASQVKALVAGGAISKEVNPAGLVGFLLWGSVPGPATIRRDVRSLPPGSYLVVDRDRVSEPHKYFRFQPIVEKAEQTLAEALADSVRAHLVADVPVAVFLSAGLDSTMLAALAAREVGSSLITLTIRTETAIHTPFDEGEMAAKVAKVLGSQHVEWTVTHDDVPDLWEKVLAAMDQPSIDGFNSYLVSQMAHQAGVKVVLSGLGGDELFGSYPSFRDVPRWQRWANRVGYVPGLRSFGAAMARLVRPCEPKLPGLLRYGRTLPGSYFMRRGLYLPEEIEALIDPELARLGLAAYNPIDDAASRLDYEADSVDPWQTVHILESTMYMRNQLLRDADWASMAHSLELRVPLVDVRLHRQVAALAFEPARSQGKAAVSRIVAPELPGELTTLAKSGFSLPVLDLLRLPHGPGRPNLGRESRALALHILDEFK